MPDVFGNILDDAGRSERGRLPDGVLDGEVVGGAVGLDDRLGNAHQRGAAHLARVHQLFELLQPAGDHQGGELGQQALSEHGLELPGQKSAGPFHGLEENIAGVAVGDDHVRRAVDRLAGLHVAHEVDAPRLARLLEQGVGLPLQVHALGLLHADVQQAHLGLGPPQYPLGVVRAHKRELQEILRRALGGGAAVDEYRAPRPGRHHRGQGRPADPADPLNQQGGCRQDGPGAACGNKRVGGPVLQQVEAHGQGGVLLFLEGGGRIVAHLHHLGGMGDLHAGGQIVHAVFLEYLQDFLPTADQDDLYPQFPHGAQRTPHVGDGRVVPAHGVYDDLHATSLFRLSWSVPETRLRRTAASPLRGAVPGAGRHSFKARGSSVSPRR